MAYLLVFMVVTQPHTIFGASVRINYRYILKLNKLTWLTSHRRLAKELMTIFFSLFFCFCIGFVFVLDLTKTKIFSGITYHHNKVLCKCFIHLVDVVSATVDKTMFASFEIGEEYEGTEFFKSQDDIMRCFPFS